MNHSVFVGERLKEERQRLELSQTLFGDIGGVTKKTQMLYESGERSPDSTYLSAIAGAGADIQYIVTGEHSDMALTPDERELLALFRSAPLAVKAAAIGALQSGGAMPSSVKKQINVTASGGQAAGRDIVNTKTGGRKNGAGG